MAGRKRCSAFSLPELIVTVAVVSIMAAIAIISISGVDRDAAFTVATRNLNMLNGAVNGFNTAHWELFLSPDPGTSDEQAIFYSLQYGAAGDPLADTPALPNNVPFVTTSSEEAYRGIWNGRFFQILEPGIIGEGVDLGGMTGSVGGGPPTGFVPVPPQ